MEVMSPPKVICPFLVVQTTYMRANKNGVNIKQLLNINSTFIFLNKKWCAPTLGENSVWSGYGFVSRCCPQNYQSGYRLVVPIMYQLHVANQYPGVFINNTIFVRKL